MTDTSTPLKMPDSTHFIDRGHTGNAIAGRRNHPPDKVMNFCVERSRNYPQYVESKWDCEDFAFLAASEVRCAFTGQPVGILVGKGTDGNEKIVGKEHAINVLWFQKEGGQNVWYPRYFDATQKREVTGINTELVIALPILASGDAALYTRLNPFDNNKYPFEPIAAFELDDTYDFTQMSAVEGTLARADSFELCPEPPSKEERDLFRDPYWTPGDDTFWWFSHIRKMHMGAPVGVAFGRAVTKKSPNGFGYSALVLWGEDNKIRYWDTGAWRYADEMGYTFNPRVVIV
jgi:hypothetical protein